MKKIQKYHDGHAYKNYKVFMFLWTCDPFLRTALIYNGVRTIRKYS